MRRWLCAALSVATLAACDDDSSSEMGSDSGTDMDTDGGTPGDGSADDAGGGGDGSDGTCTALPETVDSDLTVGPGCVTVDRSIVTENATLTIKPGTTVKMAASGFLDVSPYGDGSALVAVGTAEAPIVFTSANAAPQAGDWECVHIGGASAATEIRFATFEYGGTACSYNGAGDEGELIVNAAARAISDNVFRHSSSHGVNIRTDGAVRGFANNAFEDNQKPGLYVAAPQLVKLGTGLTFADADDFILVDSTFALEETGTVLGQPVPFRIGGSFNIGEPAEVTLGAGARFEMNGGSFIVFFANLIVAGTEEAPVVFTSSQASPTAGDWGCISLETIQGTPRIDHAVIEYGGNGMGCRSGAMEKTGLYGPDNMVVTNTTFSNIDGPAIMATTCTDDWCTSNTFESVTTPRACGFEQTPTACP